MVSYTIVDYKKTIDMIKYKRKDMIYSGFKATPIVATHTIANGRTNRDGLRQATSRDLEVEATRKDLGEQIQPKGMKWGAPTWYLLHTLAQKVKPDRWPTFRLEFVQTLYTICKNLPCPDCAQHAKQYLAQWPPQTITSPEALRHLFFHFHNSVNARKGFPLFAREDLDARYASANTMAIVNHFLYFFRDKSTSLKQMSNDLYRQRLVDYLQNWFLQHFDDFDM